MYIGDNLFVCVCPKCKLIHIYNVCHTHLCRFEPRSDQTKDYAIGICCFSAKHAALRRKSKDWLSRNHDNVTEWGDMSFYWYSALTLFPFHSLP